MSDIEYNQGFSFSIKSPWNTVSNITGSKDFTKASQESQNNSQAHILGSFNRGNNNQHAYQELGVRWEINLKSMVQKQPTDEFREQFWSYIW